MGMSIASSRASSALVSQPVAMPANPAPAVNVAPPSAPVVQPLQLNTEGLIGTLVNMRA
jgi:hypothetical protein